MRFIQVSVIFIVLIISFDTIFSADIIYSKNGKLSSENTQVNLTATKHNLTANVNPIHSQSISLNANENEKQTAVTMHKGREHVIESVISGKQSSTTDKSASTHINPIYEKLDLDIPPQQDGEKPSVPKKGVSFPDINETIQEKLPSKLNPSVAMDPSLLKIFNVSNTASKAVHLNSNKTSTNTTRTSVTIQHKKPLVTESDDDYIDKMSKTIKKDNLTNDQIALDQIDPLLIRKKTKSADYIVPIVAVILSVPLVAIAISFIYKRSSDWWEHRNYKRMDFLIEGMYHN